MANFKIAESPEFSLEMRKLETTDPAHADLFNGMFQILLDDLEYLKRGGRVKIGASDTELDCGDTLFVTEDDSEFLAAAYSNFTLSKEAPAVADVGNWGMVEGDLAVSEEAPTDAVFFADVSPQEE